MAQVPAVIDRARQAGPAIEEGIESASAAAANHCERNHKFYAKVSIDIGLLITTLVQLRVVVGEDRKKDYMMVYLLYLFIAISLLVQLVILMSFVSMHFVRQQTQCTRLKFFMSQGIFLTTVLNILSACLVEALVELPAQQSTTIATTAKPEFLLN